MLPACVSAHVVIPSKKKPEINVRGGKETATTAAPSATRLFIRKLLSSSPLKRESTVKKNKMLFDKIGYYLGSFTPVFVFFPCLPSKPSSPRFYHPFPFSLPFCPLSFTSKQESNSGKLWIDGNSRSIIFTSRGKYHSLVSLSVI